MDYTQMIESGKVVLVEFFASWCPHCHKMMPVVGQIEELLAGRVPVYKLDIDDNQDAAAAASVDTVPTFLLYADGKLVWRHSGEIDGEVLYGKVESFL